MAVIKQWAKQRILFPVENIYVGHGYLGRHMMCWQHKEMWNKLKGQKGSWSCNYGIHPFLQKCMEGRLKGESWSLSDITWGFILSTPLYNLQNPTFLTVINGIFISATNAPINVMPARGRGRAWGGDLIVFVGPGVRYLTDPALPGEGVFECFFTKGALMGSIERFKIQWNPVNMVTNGPKKFGRITRTGSNFMTWGP